MQFPTAKAAMFASPHSAHHGPLGRSASNPWKLVSFALAAFIVFMFVTRPFGAPTTTPTATVSSKRHGGLWWQDHVRALADPEPVQVVLPPPKRAVGGARTLSGDADGVSTLSFEEREQARAAHQRVAGAEAFASWRKGVDYFADYDLAAIAPPPQWSKEGPREFEYVNASTSPYFIRWISDSPRIAVVPEFLSDEECDSLVAAAEKKLFRSQVAVYKGAKEAGPISDVRTSSQAWLDLNSDPAQSVTQRIFALTGFRKESSEQLQILRYEKGQRYDAHEDFFSPDRYGHQTTNRALTAYLYLSDVDEGGHTWFPMAHGRGHPPSFISCDVGLGFKPHKRTLVLFYDAFPDQRLDPTSLHGSCPVKRGIKWGGTLWLRIQTPNG